MLPMCRCPLGRESRNTPNEVSENDAIREHEMFEYEMATARHAELIRRADAYRLVREARKALRRTSSQSQEPEGSVRGHRSRFARAA